VRDELASKVELELERLVLGSVAERIVCPRGRVRGPGQRSKDYAYLEHTDVVDA
jgi:hypothetical protein